MNLNKVIVTSKDNCVEVFVDGIKINKINTFNIQRNGNDLNAIITVAFECDLETKEQSID